jgi:formate dehydrogenase major subunit
MPASEEEVLEAEEEGVKIMYLVAPVEVIGNGKVEGIRMVTHVLGQQDKSGRRRPEVVPETYFILNVDTIIWAIGQEVTSGNVNELELTSEGFIKVDPATCATSLDGVFAGGDCVRGPATVIMAIADGKRSAVSIDRYLGGNFLQYDPEKTVVNKDDVLLRSGNLPRKWRPLLEKLPAIKRRLNFREYRKILSEEEAIQEARRCLACGCGAGCEICKNICKMFAWSVDETAQVVIDPQKCVACGMCIHRCPNKNIKMVRTSDVPIHRPGTHS